MSATPYRAIITPNYEGTGANVVNRVNKTRTIEMMPLSPEWISRQRDEEILTLPWGWNNGTANVQRHEIINLLNRRARLKVVFMSVTLILLISGLVAAHQLSDESYFFRVFNLFLITFTLLYFLVFEKGSHFCVTRQLEVKFSEGVLSKGPKIRVISKDYRRWLHRQTEEEIQSFEGWTEGDYALLVPLLKRRRLAMHIGYVALSINLICDCIQIFPLKFDSMFGDVLVCGLLSSQIVLFFGLCSHMECNSNVILMFDARFGPFSQRDSNI